MDELTSGIPALNPGDLSQQREMRLESYMTSLLKGRLSRRELLKAGGLTGMSLPALWALACQPTAPAPTPTKAPVAVAPTPTKAPAGTPTPEKIGKQLIGKLEGPETITDPAKFPKAFKEAPAWAEMVKAGKLPAVKERIGEDPLVVKPVHEIGKYGGTWRRGSTGPTDVWNGYRVAVSDHLVHWDYTGTKLVPLLAKGWEFGDGGKTITIYLRRGVKWSDGQPFTADDFMFWWDDVYQNKELVATPSPVLSTLSGPGKLEKVDGYTIRWKFPDPYYVLPVAFTGNTGLFGHAANGRHSILGGYLPAHYMKQFHPKYVSKEELDKKVKEGKFDNWVSLFKNRNDWTLNPDVPALTAWKTTTPINTPTWTLERNPYSWVVDTEGNQLPYLDKIVIGIAENLEVLNLRAIAGDYDMQARHLDILKLPVFLANQAKGGYKVYLDPSPVGADLALIPNQSYEADPEIAKWLSNTDFRRALALGFDRNQLNETFWLGLGTPGSAVPEEATLYNPGPEYRTLWSTYDPKKANEMLDKIGLDKKDAEGFRLRTDGKGRLRIEVMTFVGFLQFTQICEMIKEHWKKIGIQADVVEVERSLSGQRLLANEHQIRVDNLFATEHLFAEIPMRTLPLDQQASIGPLYGIWFASGGKKGKEPPPLMKEVQTWYRQAFSVPEKEHIELGKKIWRVVIEEQWNIGTVGLSPSFSGVRVVKAGMSNVPQRMVNGSQVLHPKQTRPETYFWKS